MEYKIKQLDEVNIEEAKKLYKEAFNDSDEFINYYFSSYSKNNLYYFWLDQNDKIVMMACLNRKRIYYSGEKISAGFIVAVAVNKEMRGKKILTNNFQKWLDDISLMADYIFIQAYNWDVYKKYDFHPCCIKHKYQLRKDQILKPVKYKSGKEVDIELINEIYNQFLKINRIKNYTYRTTKESILYYKMLLSTGEKIYHSKKSYIVVSNDTIVDFAFTDLRDFIQLLSNFEDKLFIYSYILLDKRFFKDLSEKKIDAKIYKIRDFDLLFNETF